MLKLIPVDHTWDGYLIYDSSAVDDHIEQCDMNGQMKITLTKSAGPFTVFTANFDAIPHPRAQPSDIYQIFTDLQDTELHDKSALFHHYTNQIAPDMMPFEDIRNPWLSFYPSMALSSYIQGHKSLLYAILAQAAGNLAHLGYERDEMLKLAMKLYGAAIQHLGRSIERGATQFSILLATVLALIMAEARHFSLPNEPQDTNSFNFAGIRREIQCLESTPQRSLGTF